MKNENIKEKKYILTCTNCNSTDIHQKAGVWIAINDLIHTIDMDDLFYEKKFWCCRCNQKVNTKRTEIN